jgi:structural maintenance of chromosome 2
VRQRTGGLSFEYTPPSADFDRSAVHGLVATLLTLPAAHADKAAALEQAAGARLHNVVVRDERVGAALLARGRLRKRVTLIPLSKITPRVFTPAVRRVPAGCMGVC